MSIKAVSSYYICRFLIFSNMMHKAGSIWHKWDLHIHTNASDGKGSCQEILDEAKLKQCKNVLQ